MKSEAQRIAIAEACGWTYHGNPELKFDAIMCWTPFGREYQPMNCIPLPDYLNDLNAIHNAEMAMTDSERGIMRAIMYKSLAEQGAHCGEAIHATAAQRAEAFLRTIGKWQEPAGESE